MYRFISLIVVLLFIQSARAQLTLNKLWETDSVVAIPESVLADPANGVLYVSLINGAPWEFDGKGGIGKLSTDGKNYDSTWVTGLHAPKGMGISNGRLYVADMNAVIAIDLKSGKVVKKIDIDSAKQLNDVTVSSNGIIYVSDSRAGKVYRLEQEKSSLYLENLPGINGLKAVGDDLIISAGKSFVRADAQKQIHPIAQLPQGGDGIEPIGNGDYLATAWAGYIYYVHADGKVDTLLDTRTQKRNAADIGYDPVKKIIYVPTFFAKTVAAYQLK